MTNPKASIIIIGNEILSGRTLDTNTQEIALRLGEIGIIVHETRTIPDDKELIIETTRHLSKKYDYVFTTGGIGPTHDDITAEAIADAFNVKLVLNQTLYNILKDHYANLGESLNAAREKMAYIPESAILLSENNITLVPGFAINNVFVLAGIPRVMQVMLKAAIPLLRGGTIVKSKSIEAMVGESKIAAELTALQNKYRNVDLGSYPFTKNNKNGTCLVLRSTDYLDLDAAFDELKKIVDPYCSL